MRKLLLLLSLTYLFTIPIYGQQQDSIVNIRLQEYFNNYRNTYVTPKLVSFNIDYDKRDIYVEASDEFTYQAFRPATVDSINSQIQSVLPGPVRYFTVHVSCNGVPIDQLIPNYYRKAAKRDRSRLETDLIYKGRPWIENLSQSYDISRGLQNRYIGLWQSHGKYYSRGHGWLWQRPRLFCTTEDLFSQSFVLPYLIPMLEHAGATVVTPRERDIQNNEVIVDNDTKDNLSRFTERGTSHGKWRTADGTGFGGAVKTLTEHENPFEMGTARCADADRRANRSVTEWTPYIPAAGRYAVYISYKTLPNSVDDAHYTIYHKGEATEFKVNQQMGGGTWVYLGTYDFDRGTNDYDKVALTNESSMDGVVTADAVRFGGGMGNIAREGSTSGLPRYLEGARYFAQWSGMPERVYNGRKDTDDYADDINARSLMINYLAGGSIYNPNNEGLKVPFELSMAFHTDAGYSSNGFIGTLGIYTTAFNDGKLYAGTSRMASRDLCDIVLTNITDDIDRTYGVHWERRAMWNRNYSESRVPAVPSSIIEMLSHQNFNDLKLACDPNFKFTLSRAIYKGILRFIATEHHEDYEVQPLPVARFAIDFGLKKHTVTLSWQGVNDPLEASASPRSYVVYQKTDDSSFDNGTAVTGTSYTLKLDPGRIYSFYVTAVNRGGESFPSETLSAMLQKKVKERALIVNGFTRLSTPYIVDTPDSLGFDIDRDPGVAYQKNISLCGHQICFNREAGGREGEGSLGYSNGDMEGRVVAGNTFDYPYIHGKAIRAAGKWSFVSYSRDAFESLIGNGDALIKPDEIDRVAQYQFIDVIMGLQKNDKNTLRYYKTFTKRMKGVLKSYTLAGGNLLVSGSYLGSDNVDDRHFCNDVLKYGYDSSLNDRAFDTSFSGRGISGAFLRSANDMFYAVTAPEALTPVSTATVLLRYAGKSDAAAIYYDGDSYRTCTMGFPFESIENDSSRSALMRVLLRSFEKKR